MMSEVNVTLSRPIQLLLFNPKDGVPIDDQDSYQLEMRRLIEEGWAVSDIVRLGKLLSDPRQWTGRVLAQID
jgi:hypothetical protein